MSRARTFLRLVAAGGAACALAFAADPARAQESAWSKAMISTSERAQLVDRDGLTRAGERILRRLETAEADGLDPAAYDVDGLHMAIAEAAADPGAAGRAEAMLAAAFARYARDLHAAPAEDMTYVDAELKPAAGAPEALLESAAGSASLERALGTHPIYEKLRSAFLGWRERWGRLPAVPIPDSARLAPGFGGAAASALRERLGLDREGSFQAAHGLTVSGLADEATLALLNADPKQFEAKLLRNLARARALPAEAERYILVDAAARRLWMYERGRAVDSMRVVVGRVTDPTPMLAAYVREAVLNPYWNVPPDLVASRVAPKVLERGLRHLDEEGYEILSDWSDGAAIVDPATIDWKAVAAGKQELVMRQKPGPKNSMGAMKFMFPNRHGVYLHDTPDKALFASDDRNRSAGCVRLEDAPRLARWLFGTMPQAASGAPEQAVPLEKPVPVYITYLTAAPTADGIALREDVYGRDSGSGAVQLAGGR
jgi:murein L,D-transpeptidase YcbB/YkuD